MTRMPAWYVYLLALLGVGLITWVVVDLVRDQHAQDRCVDRGGVVQQAEHGEGWSCINP